MKSKNIPQSFIPLIVIFAFGAGLSIGIRFYDLIFFFVPATFALCYLEYMLRSTAEAIVDEHIECKLEELSWKTVELAYKEQLLKYREDELLQKETLLNAEYWTKAQDKFPKDQLNNE